MFINPDNTIKFKGWKNRRDKAALRAKQGDARAPIRAARAAAMARHLGGEHLASVVEPAVTPVAVEETPKKGRKPKAD